MAILSADSTDEQSLEDALSAADAFLSPVLHRSRIFSAISFAAESSISDQSQVASFKHEDSL
jgi:hypothetical protein